MSRSKTVKEKEPDPTNGKHFFKRCYREKQRNRTLAAKEMSERDGLFCSVLYDGSNYSMFVCRWENDPEDRRGGN